MKKAARGRTVVWVVALAGSLLVDCGTSVRQPEFILEGDFGRATDIYTRQCSVCHGAEGFGDGKAAYLVHPRPRDFSYGKFLLVSTDNRVPTDEDLFSTISRGMPGSAMPSWEHLPEQDRRDLVRYVRALTHRGRVLRLTGDRRGPVAAGEEEQLKYEPLPRSEAEEVATELLEIGGPLGLPPAAPASDELLARGREVYVSSCSNCHGDDGKGGGSEVMVDDLGFRAFPRDFTGGIFKGGTSPGELAYRILGSMPGSAMPSSAFETGDDLWAVVHHVRSLIAPGAQERVEQHRLQLAAERATETLSDDPLDEIWTKIEPSYVALMPLWWRDDRVESVDVRAAHDGENLAVHLTWNDAGEDMEQLHVTSFGDAAAVQFSSGVAPPFFGMGDDSAPVNIWLWKAVWENDLPDFHDISRAYPRALMDLDQSVKQMQPSQSAHIAAKVEERDPTFYGGWGAGNLISSPERPGSVEDLNAKGLGTLHSQALKSQNVRGKGARRDGAWQVVFLRPLRASDSSDIEFQPGGSVSVAFAIWDGRAGDRNGQKSVTIWHDISLGE